MTVCFVNLLYGAFKKNQYRKMERSKTLPMNTKMLTSSCAQYPENRMLP